MKKNIIVIFMFITSAFFLIGCDSKENSPIEDSKLLTHLVYNSCISENEDYRIVDVNRNSKFSNGFHFISLKVIQSFGMKVSFDFVMTPYLDDYVIGDEVDVVFAYLELLISPINKAYSKMIIFSYKDNIVGFISSSGGSGDIESIPDNYDSSLFLTENEIVKYYEKGDILYNFTLSQDENNQYQLNGLKAIGFTIGEPISFDVTVLENTYTELSCNQVIDLVYLSKIEKIEVVATITGFVEDSNRINVHCDSIPTLKSVYYSMAILDEYGNTYNYSDLKIGDKIKIYYYQRYRTYEPVNISVENIIIY